ncbi:MAG: dihydrolipoamide acetyltransferase family protein [Pseudomonadota bacterium]
MSQYVFKLPDLGEGTVEAEIGEWHVKVGDVVNEDDVIVDMMTDKAAVEIPSPVSGRIASLHGSQGDIVAVGTNLIVFDLEGESTDADRDAPEKTESAAPANDTSAQRSVSQPASAETAAKTAAPAATAPTDRRRILTSPAVRARAKQAGVDLASVPGTGAKGRILKKDLEAFIARGGKAPVVQTPSAVAETDEVEEHRVIGVRRVIARKMSESKRNIPHFTYVDEIDVTQFDELRRHLNANRTEGQPKLTFLPLLIQALARTLKAFPQCNATYVADREVVIRHAALNVGIATQTDDGLKVPVIRQAQAKDVWQLAGEIVQLSELARNGKAKKDQLTGSSITITSLGLLGGIVTTPVINAPEVGIIGINKAVQRPVVIDGQITIRTMMNLSVSFDHRFVDGYDAADMVRVMKGYIEHPATIFMP